MKACYFTLALPCLLAPRQGPVLTGVQICVDVSLLHQPPCPCSLPVRGQWYLDVRGLPPGSYAYKFVVDGNSWVADPDQPQASGAIKHSIVNGTSGVFCVSLSVE